MNNLSIPTCLGGVVPPASFLLILWALLEPRCSPQTARRAAAGFLAAEGAAQWAVLALGGNLELVLTLLPLTFYLPAIVLTHLLSGLPFVPTAVSWLLALLCQHLLLTARKLLILLFSQLSGAALDWVVGGCLLLSAVVLTAVVLWSMQKPFQACAGRMDANWAPLLCLPIMLLMLHSWFLSAAVYPTVLLLLLLTALAALWALVQLMTALAEEAQARAAQLQMEALRQDYELLQKKLELGRSYRHDMRHHILALSALLQQKELDAALDYVSNWQGQLTQIESRSWCRSAAVNAVLSSYFSQAKEAGCTLEAKVSLPETFPVEELDLCVVLANALENALHACREMPEGAPRQLSLELVPAGRRLTLHVENSCSGTVEPDADGFPVTRRGEGHGQGLRSIAAVAEKYHGMFRYSCSDGVFGLWMVLPDSVPEQRRIRRIPAVCTGVFLFLFLLNCMPTLALALEQIPVLGAAVRIVDLRSYSWFWGDTGLSVQYPVLDGDEEAVDQAEAARDDFIRRMEETFVRQAAQKYQGYTAGDITYEVTRDDDALFILRFSATLNAGGSVDYYQHVVLDKSTGQVLSLSDLFQPGANYIFPISREIKAQMAEQMNAGQANYFLPGGIWPEEVCFQSIDPEQDFYVDESGRLVIVFAEYEVAPGSMGTPEFTIPTEALGGLLAQPTALK